MHKRNSASFVVINREGWILTATPIHRKSSTAIREIQLKTQSYFESLTSIQADAALSPKQAKAKIRALKGPSPAPKDVQHCAVWWGSNEAKRDAGGNSRHKLRCQVIAILIRVNSCIPSNKEYFQKLLTAGPQPLEARVSFLRRTYHVGQRHQQLRFGWQYCLPPVSH